MGVITSEMFQSRRAQRDANPRRTDPMSDPEAPEDAEVEAPEGPELVLVRFRNRGKQAGATIHDPQFYVPEAGAELPVHPDVAKRVVGAGSGEYVEAPPAEPDADGDQVKQGGPAKVEPPPPKVTSEQELAARARLAADGNEEPSLDEVLAEMRKSKRQLKADKKARDAREEKAGGGGPLG